MSKLEGIKNRTLKDRISDLVRNAVLSGNFPREFITERELSEQLQVSRTPLREAMYELINEDLIEFRPRKGYRIKPHDKSEVEQIFKLRFVIEREIVETLIKNVTDKDIEYLKKLVNEQEEIMSHDRLEFIKIDKEFHRYLFRISELDLFLKSYDQFHNLTILIGFQAIQKIGRMKVVLDEHRLIIEMLEKKDREGLINAIQSHLKQTFHVLYEEEL
ncbi:MAG TPA: GntR family transcriptional regulator [Aliicoccus persicus]|uniref:GntR family transcriptional regulator n=1 Tax=Aliicoccus persicus TaxID=930138 RepID=A0A921JC35_9STAP|nr:GntR family transcriptional regulator [Aliicoccus persicus]